MPRPTLCAGLEAVQAVAVASRRAGSARPLVRRSRETEVDFANGRRRHRMVRDESFVAPWLTIVRWRPEGARFDRSIVIVPGMLPEEDFQRLRIMLRWG